MKLAKKILVAVLALALLASCLLFSASADEEVEIGGGADVGGETVENPFRADGITKIDDILEYYSCDAYLANGYDDGVLSSEYMSQDKDYSGTSAHYPDIYVGIEKSPTDETNDVLLSRLPSNKSSKYIRSSGKGNVWTEMLFLTFDIYFEEGCEGNLTYDVKVGIDSSSSLASILKFDFTPMKNGESAEIEYSKWNESTGAFSSLVPHETFVPKTGVWYSVTISYNAVDDVYYSEIVGSDGSKARIDLVITGAPGVWGFECTGKFNTNTAYPTCTETKHKQNIEKYDTFEEDAKERKCKDGLCRASVYTEYYIDDIEIYEGSYIRFPARKHEIVKTTLEDLSNLRQVASREDKFEIAKVLDALYNGNDTVTAINDEELRAVIPDAIKYINETYANEIILRAAAINTSNNYYARLEYLETIFDPCDALLPVGEALAGLEGITVEIETAINDARVAVAEEKAMLEQIKTHSETFVAAMNAYDVDNKVYDYVVQMFEEGKKDIYNLRDVEYEGVADANAVYDGIVAKYERMNADIDAFVDAFSAMEAHKKFGELYNAYVLTYKLYNKYGVPSVINPDLNNSTYIFSAEAGEDAPAYDNLAQMILAYDALAEVVLTKKAECDAFNLVVQQASNATYYPVQKKIVEEAKTKLVPIEEEFDYRSDYPGIADSYNLYNSLVIKLDKTLSDSQEYINAVNSISEAEGFYEIQAAVRAAKALKAEGDNLGVEGVMEANLALTAIEAEINCLEGNSTSLISLVAQIENATTLSARRQLIIRANKALDNGVATDYIGVNEAIAELEAAIEAFEEEVAALNSALANATNNVITMS